MKDTEITDKDIATTFLPLRTPKIPRVYIRFYKQDHADLCLKLAKGLKDSDVKIFRYFPRQFQARVRALEDAAYPLRKTSVPKYKTEVVYTDSDVQLMVCQHGSVRYFPHHVPNLPPIDNTPARSPPKGRPRQKRDRSGDSDNSSPLDNRKSSRHTSPPKPSEDVQNDDSNKNEEVPEKPPSATPSLTEIREIDLPMPPFQTDIGGYSSIEVMSPATGRVSFDFQQPVNLRRESLNL